MLLTLKYLPLSAMSRDFGHSKFLVSLTQWWIQEEGPGGPYPLPLSDAFLRLKFLHRQDRISLFNWLIFFIERRVAFCYSTKYFCFGYPPMICSPLLAKYAKQYFPRQWWPAFTYWGSTWSSLWEVICHKKSSTVLSEQKFRPHPPPPPPLPPK